MYARYVPPKKEAKVTSEVSSTAQNIDRSSGLYARYVPPPKPTQPRKIVFSTDEDGIDEERRPAKKLKRDDLPPDEATQTKEKKETKKEKKKSKVSAADDRDEGSEPNGPVTDAQATEEVPDNELTSSRKEKKNKKEKKDKGPKSVKEGNSEDTTADRHKSVLEKKEKSLKRLKRAEKDQETSKDEEGLEPFPEQTSLEVHGLEPLPQPEPVPLDLTTPSYEILPPWLANPIRVSSKTRTPFANIGISPEYGIPPQVEKVLRSKGWNDAFAVQTAAMPLLLPSRDRQGDLVISAATGSGKTLAYVLPMVRDISRGVLTKLRAVIVVPTRELVQQAQDVCETCSRAYHATPDSKRVRIATAMGSQSFKKEQAAIMEEEQIYDPAGYQEYVRKRQGWPFIDGSTADGPDLGILDEESHPTPYHIIRHNSKVDVLICTPGRLVEHINSTPGFTLDYVRWLIIDEADKLLGQSFQQWLDVVMEKLSVTKTNDRDFEDSFQSGVRKVVLSATMTTDLSLLNSLKLSRPQHVILEGTGKGESVPSSTTEYTLPEGLRESAIKIRDDSQKPLYLVELLGRDFLRKSHAPEATKHLDLSDDDATSSEDEDGSISDDDASSKGSTPGDGAFPTSVLIFTKSNESALRLSRLLSLLAPELGSVIGTLTSTTRTSERRKTIRAFTTKKIKILVASDLTARGIDLPDLDHVVNYDMPPSAEVYVHRVGRTARAGREGHAWTLFTKKEAGWFWPEVAGQGKSKGARTVTGTGGSIKRSNKVEKANIGAFSDDKVAQYETALAKLGEEAAGRTQEAAE